MNDTSKTLTEIGTWPSKPSRNRSPMRRGLVYKCLYI